jgi:hypothetical protein
LTGVLVSVVIRPESVPALALEKALLQFEICASDETLAELETVLMRPKFDPYVRARLTTGICHRTLGLDLASDKSQGNSSATEIRFSGRAMKANSWFVARTLRSLYSSLTG